MRSSLSQVVDALKSVLLGKEHQVQLALATLLAQGHLLIEDLPGMGKTTLALGLSRVLGLSHRRVQFTVDVLPSDITGMSMYRKETETFEFRPGPIFSHLLLTDEINRAMPKTQSALLEAMEEMTVSQDGETHALPSPFFVIATQNPYHHAGTYPLPESQLDRFLMAIEMGYPDEASERQLLSAGDQRSHALELPVLCSPEQILAFHSEVQSLHCSDSILNYIMRLVSYSRTCEGVSIGLSPRAGLGLLSASRAWAFLMGRDFVSPEDVQTVFEPVARHRLKIIQETGGGRGNSVARVILNAVDVVG